MYCPSIVWSGTYTQFFDMAGILVHAVFFLSHDLILYINGHFNCFHLPIYYILFLSDNVYYCCVVICTTCTTWKCYKL